MSQAPGVPQVCRERAGVFHMAPCVFSKTALPALRAGEDRVSARTTTGSAYRQRFEPHVRSLATTGPSSCATPELRVHHTSAVTTRTAWAAAITRPDVARRARVDAAAQSPGRT